MTAAAGTMSTRFAGSDGPTVARLDASSCANATPPKAIVTRLAAIARRGIRLLGASGRASRKHRTHPPSGLRTSPWAAHRPRICSFVESMADDSNDRREPRGHEDLTSSRGGLHRSRRRVRRAEKCDCTRNRAARERCDAIDVASFDSTPRTSVRSAVKRCLFFAHPPEERRLGARRKEQAIILGAARPGKTPDRQVPSPQGT